MDDSLTGTLKFFLPQIPSLTKAIISHSMGISPTSSKWDLRTEITIHVLRAFMKGTGKPMPIGQLQAHTLKDPGPKGKTWIAKTTIPAPEDETLCAATFKAIEELGDGTESYVKPGLASIPAEWTGFRKNAEPDAPLPPDMSEQDRYNSMMAGTKNKTTLLYFHGGAYFLCGFGTHRLHVSKLAKACDGRALSVGYRLAPQAAFPSQLLDALNSYLYLLYPPPGALHEPVAATDIVFGGDSAGGNLVFALLQLLLQMHRTNESSSGLPKVRYHGKEVEVPLPAGVSSSSPWLDISRALPSIAGNAIYDYLPAADHDDATSKFPADDIWPADPPRGDLFCDLSMLCHPLVSPVAAKDWSGAPPIWIQTGEEMLSDEDALLASQAASQGVPVRWQEYEAMPHCFAMVLTALPNSVACIAGWGSFLRECVHTQGGRVGTMGIKVAAKTNKVTQVDVASVSALTLDDALTMMRTAQAQRMKGWETEGKMMPKPSL